MSYTAPSGAPLGLRSTGVGARSLSLDWDLPLLRDRNGPITSYRVNLTALEVGSVLIYVITSSRIGFSNLHPYYTYSCRVQAVNPIGRGPFSSAINVTTLSDGRSGCSIETQL